MADPTSDTRFFYQGNRLHAVQSNEQCLSLCRGEGRPLAQFSQDTQHTDVLVCDERNSVLQVTGSSEERIRYSAYGYATRLPSARAALGFNGEFVDRLLRSYVLGSYRLYNPALMRFCAPDSDSPFHRGGINAYGYCLGDPVNFQDASGHAPYRSQTRQPKRIRHPDNPSNRPRQWKTSAKKSPSQSTAVKPSAGITAPPASSAAQRGFSTRNDLGPLPEQVMLTVNYEQYNELKSRLSRDAQEVFRLFDTNAIDVETMRASVSALQRIDEVAELKRAYSEAHGFFYQQSVPLPVEYASSPLSIVSASVESTRRKT